MVTPGPAWTTPSATSPRQSRCGTRTSTSVGWASCNFPPDYPKMPGEPPRVQPSKRRKDKADEDYIGPKADATPTCAVWGLPVVPPVSPMLAKPVKGIPTGELPVRAQVGRLPLDHLPLRRLGRDRQPQREADDPLLPRGRRGRAGELPGASASSTARSCVIGPGGDRLDFDALQQRIHPAASRVKQAVAAETPAQLRRVRPARARRRGPDASGRSPSAGRCSRRRSPTRTPPIHLTRATARPRRSRRSGSSSSRAPGSTASIAKPLDGTYEPDKRVMLKIKHERTADCVVAGYRTHKSGDGPRSGRCCSASTTTTAR